MKLRPEHDVPIRVWCPSCADVQVVAADLTIRVCTDTRRWSYCFRCPVCRVAVSHESDARLLDEIAGLGVRTELWRLPAELGEPHPDGPAFTWDDVLDFHLLLADQDKSPQPN